MRGDKEKIEAGHYKTVKCPCRVCWSPTWVDSCLCSYNYPATRFLHNCTNSGFVVLFQLTKKLFKCSIFLLVVFATCERINSCQKTLRGPNICDIKNKCSKSSRRWVNEAFLTFRIAVIKYDENQNQVNMKAERDNRILYAAIFRKCCVVRAPYCPTEHSFSLISGQNHPPFERAGLYE